MNSSSRLDQSTLFSRRQGFSRRGSGRPDRILHMKIEFEKEQFNSSFIEVQDFRPYNLVGSTEKKLEKFFI
jgi:hypothetical protein